MNDTMPGKGYGLRQVITVRVKNIVTYVYKPYPPDFCFCVLHSEQNEKVQQINHLLHTLS
jgi:hypothetical protein